MNKEIIKSAVFVKSSESIETCPSTDKPEFAFIGRSNVGKSSLINMLCGRKELAKISSTPGKTITINHFLINDQWYLVDLPGYGYAKRSKNLRSQWNHSTKNYISERENLVTVFVLVDSNIQPQDSDLEFIHFLGEEAISPTIVFTKIDRISKNERNANIREFMNELSESYDIILHKFESSAKEKTGRDEILGYIQALYEASKRHGGKSMSLY